MGHQQQLQCMESSVKGWGGGGTSLKFLPDETICMEQVLKLEHLVALELVLSEEAFTPFGLLLFHLHILFICTWVSIWIIRNMNARSILTTLLLAIVLRILL